MVSTHGKTSAAAPPKLLKFFDGMTVGVKIKFDHGFGVVKIEVTCKRSVL